MKRTTRKPMKALALAAALTLAVTTAAPAFGAGKITKEETVYVVTDDAGATTDIIVSDHLKNSTESKTIQDKSDLTDIENVKGEETFKQGKDMALTWKADGNDIFYEGKPENDPPVTMDITYKLDEEIVSGEELKGKSGDLEIRIDFENNAKVNVDGREETVPFMALTGLLASDESFSDVTVDQGKVIDDGDKLIIVGMALPGLREDLHLDNKEVAGKLDLDIKDSITITATVKDYDVENMMTIVSNALFDEMDTEEIGSLEYDDQIKALDQGAKALADGAGQLADGLNTLEDSMPQLEEGTQQLKDGADQLSEGTDAALAGAKQLNSGSIKLRGTLKIKMRQIAKASGQMEDGTEIVIENLKTIKTGLDKKDPTGKKPGAIQALDIISTGLFDGAQKSEEGAEKLRESAQGLQGAVDGLAQISGQLEPVIDRAEPEVENLNEGVDQLNAAMDAYGGTEGFMTALGLSDAQKNGLRDVLNGYKDAATGGAQLSEGELDALKGAVQGVDQVHDGLQDAPGKLNDAADEMETSGKSLEQAAQGTADVEEGLKTISAGLGAYDSQRAKKGLSQNTIIGALTVIDYGLGTLKSQSESAVAKNGVLTKALNRLVGGTGDLVDGEKQLSGGASQLADGLGQFQTKAGELSDGVSQLNDGADQLSSGMSQLYEEGIRKIVDLYNNELKGSIDDVDRMVKAGKAYQIFTQLPDGMKGNVKFIYKTTIY